jgi:hypothetical protein
MFTDLHEPFVSMTGVTRCGARMGTLRDGPGGPIVATADIGASGGCLGQFRDGGGPVDVEPGHHMAVEFASDATMAVPALITDVDLATDTVTATCFANQRYLLEVFSNGPKDGGQFKGKAGPGGAIVVDTSDQPLRAPVDIVSNHDLRLSCQDAKGDSIRVDLTTP